MHPIYEAIANDEKITAPQAHLLLTLYKFMNANGECFPSYRTLYRYTKMSSATVAKNIKILVSDGWVSYKKGNESSSNIYQLNLDKIGLQSQSLTIKEDKSLNMEEKPKQINGRFYDRVSAEAAGFNWNDY
jgi:DNA-binding transcriptional MocR family regulator